MKKTLPFLLALCLLATSCITVAPEAQPTVDISFVTSTLPPTRSLVSRPTATKTGLPGTVTPTLEVTVPPDCKVAAVLIEDVTIPDGTQVTGAKPFTKTWKFKNTGTCPWQGYTVAFVSGDRMGAPDSSPVPQTLGGAFVDVSVDLTAPAADGAYTGFFELEDADGKVVPIGLEKTFWVKVRVGAGGIVSTPLPGGSPSPTQKTGGGGDCQSSTNPGFVSQLLGLLNDQRAAAGVPALTLNAQLSAAAQAHSVDQACNNMISHIGSDGSSIQQRIAAAGYSSSYSLEIIAVGGPEDAMSQWNDDALHRNAIINRSVTEVGIGWADSPNSVYGGHFTVDMASP